MCAHMRPQPRGACDNTDSGTDYVKHTSPSMSTRSRHAVRAPRLPLMSVALARLSVDGKRDREGIPELELTQDDRDELVAQSDDTEKLSHSGHGKAQPSRALFSQDRDHRQFHAVAAAGETHEQRVVACVWKIIDVLRMAFPSDCEDGEMRNYLARVSVWIAARFVVALDVRLVPGRDPYSQQIPTTTNKSVLRILTIRGGGGMASSESMGARILEAYVWWLCGYTDPCGYLTNRRGAAAPGAPAEPTGELDLDILSQWSGYTTNWPTTAPPVINGQPPNGLLKFNARSVQTEYPATNGANNLGGGTFGVVHTATKAGDTDTSSKYAVKKILPVGDYGDNHVTLAVLRELSILRSIESRYVVRLVEAFVNPLSDATYLVFEHYDKDIDTFVNEARGGHQVQEEWRRSIASHTTRGVAALHAMGVVHRDIKPANVLVRHKDNRSRPVVVLADVGIARLVGNGALPSGGAGTKCFMPPEMLEAEGRGLSLSVDIWALGCVVYFVAQGSYPFNGKGKSSVIQEIVAAVGSEHAWLNDARPGKRDGHVVLHNSKWDWPNNEYAFMMQMLQPDPTKRGAAAHKLLLQPWIVGLV